MIDAWIDEIWRAAMLPVPNVPGMIERWRCVRTLVPDDPFRQNKLLGKHGTAAEQMLARDRMIEVGPQQHSDLTAHRLHERQRALDERARLIKGRIGDDCLRAATILFREKIDPVGDVCRDHRVTGVVQRLGHFPLPRRRLPYAGDRTQKRKQGARNPIGRMIHITLGASVTTPTLTHAYSPKPGRINLS
jgi:hypothetical protein